MLTDDLFLARASCFPQASLVSSVGSLQGHLHCGRVMASDALPAASMPAVQAYRALALTSRCIHFCLSNALDRPTIQLFFRLSVCLSVSLCVCEQMVLERLRPQLHTDFHEILHAAQKCRCFVAYCLSDKPEVVCQFQKCADSDFGSFPTSVTTFFNIPAPNPIHG